MKKENRQEVANCFFVELEDTLFFQMHRIHTIMFRVANRKIKEASVPVKMEQLPILIYVHSCGPVSQQEIAVKLQRDKSSIQRSINALLNKGLLEVGIDPNDKRKKIVSITATGKFINNQIKTIMRKVEEEIFLAFDTQQKEEMIASIADTANKLDAMGGK